MNDVKRICSLCGIDRTPLKGGISPVNDRRGESLGLFGECCWQAVNQAVDESPRAYSDYGMLSTEKIHQQILDRARQIKATLQEEIRMGHICRLCGKPYGACCC